MLSPATHELFYYASAEEEIARAVVQLRGVKVVSHVLPLASPMVHKASRSHAAMGEMPAVQLDLVLYLQALQLGQQG